MAQHYLVGEAPIPQELLVAQEPEDAQALAQALSDKHAQAIAEK